LIREWILWFCLFMLDYCISNAKSHGFSVRYSASILRCFLFQAFTFYVLTNSLPVLLTLARCSPFELPLQLLLILLALPFPPTLISFHQFS